MISRVTTVFKVGGLAGLVHYFDRKLRGLLVGTAKAFETYKGYFPGKSGIEIGGPSPAFSRKGIFPVYPLVKALDNCNFCKNTIWEGDIVSGKTYIFSGKRSAGTQYIVEATAVGSIQAGEYDFLLSSHVLEHIANPILALTEWVGLLKDQGIMVLLLPDNSKTFDHRRSVTSMEHLIDDYKESVGEDDLTHLSEILALHDLTRDPFAGSAGDFEQRSIRNFDNRCLHHHVFDLELSVRLLEYVGMTVHVAEEVEPHHLLIIGKKSQGNGI